MIKFTEAKTEDLKRVINMLDMIKSGATLKEVKVMAQFSTVDMAKVRTFKAAIALLNAEYEVLAAKEASVFVIETPVITEESNDVVAATKTETQEVIERKEERQQRIIMKVEQMGGGHIKMRNNYNAMVSYYNSQILNTIEHINDQLATMRSMKEQDKRDLYHSKTLLTLSLI